MRNIVRKSGESGIALLLAIFTLLLLAALALAMLCAADLETNIAANYRDKQTSIYGSLSGLQEARDRLIPSRCDPEISSPTNCNDPIAIDTRNLGVPSLSSANVIYIINPSGGETVAPWDPTSKYFDNQLCHDMGPTGNSLLGLTNVAGVCPSNYNSVPTGSSWYVKPQGSNAAYNDSNSAAGEYYASSSTFPKPLTYKWVRITLKTNNMTPAYVLGAGTGTDATPMCWNGKYQIPATAGNGLKGDCSAIGSITLFNGTNTCTSCGFNPPIGTGYVNPVVTISGGGGSGATATAHVTNTGSGAVSSITVDPSHPGSGYTSAPSVVITGTGTGATATATIQKAGAPVASFSSVTQTSPVGCYASAFPSVALTGGGGTGASASAVMSGKTCVAGWTVGMSGTCSAYAGLTVNVGANGGGGSGFAGKVTFKSNGKSITGYSITNPGASYTTTPTSISGLSGCTLTATWTLGYQVSSVSLVNPGSGYTTAPTVTIAAPTAPSGSASPTVTANLGSPATNAGQITGVTVTNGGTGYTLPPIITFVGGGGTGALAWASLAQTGKIDMVTLTSPGSGYTSVPTVTITDAGGGTGAANAVTARLGSKSTLGRVYTLTSLGVTPSGSRTMTQAEVATPVRLPVTMPGALTIDAFSPNVNPGSSNNYIVNGNDANTCGETKIQPKASVGVIDNPNAPTNPTAVSCLTSTLGGAVNPLCPPDSGVKSNNYIGSNASPDVENVYGSLGDLTTPQGADDLAVQLMGAIPASQHFTGTQTGSSVVAAGGTLGNVSTNQCPGLYINGDFSIGPVTGCGILLVTGNLTMQGDYAWYGPVFVIGYGGSFTGGGGGHGIINGSLFVAQTRDATKPIGSDGQYPLRTTLGTPTVSFQLLGGGGNGIAYDHCWVDNLLGSLNLLMPPSNQPLKVLSIRNIY